MSFQSSLPTSREARRLAPLESSRRIVQAVNEAREELRRRGQKDLLVDAAELLGNPGMLSSYQLAINHIRAVEVYGISERLSKQEAVRRLRLVEPLPGRLASDLDEAQEVRSDPEILADAVHNVLHRAGTELPQLDAKVLASFLNRDPLKRGKTRSAIVDLQRWLTAFERSLEKDR